MYRRTFMLPLLCVAFLVSGCATSTKMAFHKETDTLSADGNPIFLMTVTCRNNYKPGYQPELKVVNVEKQEAKERKDRLNFTTDKKAQLAAGEKEEGNGYLVRMELASGDYVLRGLTGTSGTFPVMGTFVAPLNLDLTAKGSGVYYLGHVNATVRERKDGEFRAGPPIPLLDQAVTGFSGGTFDIEISDRQVEDEALFKERFPVLSNVAIQKAILPPFDREKAQKLWEGK